MAYATIMVHVGLDDASEARVGLTVDLVDRFESTLIGIAAYPPEPPVVWGGVGIAPLSTHRTVDEVEVALGQQESRFRSIVVNQRRWVEWRSAIDFPNEFLTREARAADLVVIGCQRPAAHTYPSFDAAAFLLRAGRPVLMVPNGLDRLPAARIAVAWKDTREARRVLSDSLPFLHEAEKVFVMQVSEEHDAQPARRSVDDVVKYLLRHRITTSAEVVVQTGDVTEELLNVVRREQIDLLVAGAYGRTRLGEWVFGGVTRDLLHESPVCCLFSH